MGTIKADSIQPTIAGNNLILRTGSDVERLRISPSGNIDVTEKITSASTTASDSSTTLTTKGYVDAIYQPQVTNVSGSYARLGNLLIEFGYIPITSMILDTTNNHYGAISFPIPYTQGPWSIQVTPRFSAYNAQGDIMGQVASVSLTGFTAVLNGAASGTLTNLLGYYWYAVGTA